MNQINQQDDSLSDMNLDNPSNNPEDTVSCIKWMPQQAQSMQKPYIFSVGCWDGKIRIYDVNANGYQKCLVQKSIMTQDSPVLAIDWKRDCSAMFTGGGDGVIRAIDCNTGNIVQLGSGAAHQSGISGIFWIDEMQILISTSFDSTIKFWQLGNQQPAMTLNLQHKIFCADINQSIAMFGLSSEKLWFFDLSTLAQIQNTQITNYLDNPLNSQVSCVKLFTDNKGFAIGSIDGRGHLGTLQKDNSMAGFKNNSIMTFKCHKVEESGTQTLYPVNSIGLNPRSLNKFVFTAGGEGVINYWDYQQKNKIKQFNYKGVPITQAEISPDGMLLAYALGYDWAKGIWGLNQGYKSKISVHQILDQELQYTK